MKANKKIEGIALKDMIFLEVADHLMEWLGEIEVYLGNAPMDYEERRYGFRDKILFLLDASINE